MIPDVDYRVQYVDAKSTRIRGSLAVDPEGFATIFINPRLDPDRQLKTFEHELQHFRRNDFYNDMSIQEAEGKPAPVQAAAPQPSAQQPATPPSENAPRKRPPRPLHTIGRAVNLRLRFDAVREQLPPDQQAAMDALFSHPAASVEEIKLRGYLLYGFREDNPYWKQILLTYTLFGNNLPPRLPREDSYITGKGIPHEIMKRIIYSLVEPIDR